VVVKTCDACDGGCCCGRSGGRKQWVVDLTASRWWLLVPVAVQVCSGEVESAVDTPNKNMDIQRKHENKHINPALLQRFVTFQLLFYIFTG